MCGIFGVVSDQPVESALVRKLSKLSTRRGNDASGLVVLRDGQYEVSKVDAPATKVFSSVSLKENEGLCIGHSRLVTNGNRDNQPVLAANFIVLHNGVIVNTEELWRRIKVQPELEIDTEIIPRLLDWLIGRGFPFKEALTEVFQSIEGSASLAILAPRMGLMAVASNNGSLFEGTLGSSFLFASESNTLRAVGGKQIKKITGVRLIKVPNLPVHLAKDEVRVGRVHVSRFENKSQPPEGFLGREDSLSRCSNCILPETMPFISFDDDGVCNYCQNYEKKNSPTKSLSDLEDLILSQNKNSFGQSLILPFSGGRDSSFALHTLVKEMGFKPITFTYDWGMVAPLARRNVSRMCQRLGVENIVIAANIPRKRGHIRRNLIAWLRKPDLGMLNILTAGDKHFYRHVRTVQRETEIPMNLWAVNPLEVTHFKAGFLGVRPSFESSGVYSTGLMNQLRYQALRARQVIGNPAYLNSSVFDTLAGELYRSVVPKKSYFHFFDYTKWDEKKVESSLAEYSWETAPDSSSSWRVGDSSAAFYNFVYHWVAGFSEHDTFRSNQIREGELSRRDALALVQDENRPRWSSIRWYLEVLGLDFGEVMKRITEIPALEPIRSNRAYA